MLRDQELDALWCGRGGYGATRLLAELSRELEQFPPQRLLGYSDITALFCWAKSQALPIECVHAPILCEIPDHPEPENVLRALKGEAVDLPVREGGATLENFRGPLWGGNLAVMASLAGTPWLPSFAGHAVFLEDIDEAPYRLDRYLTQLADSGQLRGNLGILLGSFTDCGDPRDTLNAIRRRCAELRLNVLGQVEVGHQADHTPIFLGREYHYQSSSGCLSCKG